MDLTRKLGNLLYIQCCSLFGIRSLVFCQASYIIGSSFDVNLEIKSKGTLCDSSDDELVMSSFQYLPEDTCLENRIHQVNSDEKVFEILRGIGYKS